MTDIPSLEQQLAYARVLEKNHKGSCAFCREDPGFWDYKWRYWREEMEAYNVEWDPTIRF